MKKAIIIGHTGQDGTYLLNLLKEKEYSLLGISSSKIYSDTFSLDVSDIRNNIQVLKIVKEFSPDEIYYLAAVHQSSSDEIIDDGELFQRSFDINVNALVNFLEGVRLHSPHTKIFYSASSHIFGNPTNMPQDENTPINPNCVYGITKSSGLQCCHFYRENHNLFTSIGIFYNHESPLRQQQYISKKIIQAAVAIKNNTQQELIVGNLDAQIDWGYAPDYMEAAYRIMQVEHPDDFVISSGELHTIRDFVEGAFTYLELMWEKYVKINPALITKKQKQNLFGCNEKIRKITGWQPRVNFNDMIKILIDEELKKHAAK